MVDAFPVHRFRIERSGVKEVYVTLDEAGRFAEVLDEPSTPLLARRLLALASDEPRRARMASSARRRAYPDAARVIVDRALKLVDQ